MGGTIIRLTTKALWQQELHTYNLRIKYDLK